MGHVKHIDRVTSAAEHLKITLAGGNEGGPISYQTFIGRWLIGNGADQGIKAKEDETGVVPDQATEYSVGQTQQGRIVVFARKHGSSSGGTMEVFENFADFRDAPFESACNHRFPESVIAAVANALREI